MNINRFYDRFYTWLLTFGPKLLLAIVIFLAGFWLIKKLLNFLSFELTKSKVDPTLRPFLVSTVNVALQVLLVLGIMQILTIQLTVFAALIGAFGVAGGLALSGTLQNFTSGIIILLLKPFGVGDNIIAQGQEGTVSMIRIFYTVVTTFDNSTVIIPNSKLSNEVIINLSREGKRRLDIELKFNYGINFDQIKDVLNKTINANDNLLKDPSHRIGVSGIDPDGYRAMVNVWVKPHGFTDIKMQLQQAIINDIKNAGIKLPNVKCAAESRLPINFVKRNNGDKNLNELLNLHLVTQIQLLFLKVTKNADQYFMKRLCLLFLVFIVFSNYVVSQVSINTNGAPPDSSAMLDVTSTNRGFLPPRMSHAAILAIKSPAEGLIVYDSTFHKPLYYNGSIWTPLNDSTITCNCVVVSAASKGAKADFNPADSTGTDNSDAIQAAIDEVNAAGGGKVLLPTGKIKITKPILIYSNISIIGCGKNLTLLYKIGTATSTIDPVPARGRRLSDSYQVNSFISIVHPSREFAYDSKIIGIGFMGNYYHPTDISIYAPRTSRVYISDVYGVNVKKGFLTYDSWFGVLENAIFESTDYGINFENDGEGQGTGTSMTLTNVWAISARIIGFNIYGLAYSSFRNIACDNFNADAVDISKVWGAACYTFLVCHGISISGIGFEGSKGAALFLNSSSVDITGGNGLDMSGFNNANFSGFFFLTDYSFLKITNVYIPPISQSRSTFWNVVVQNNSRIIAENTSLPSGPGYNRLVQNGSEIIENSTYYNQDGVVMKVKLEAL